MLEVQQREGEPETKTTEHIDKTGECQKCPFPIEHVAGIRDPYWRHQRATNHPARPKN